MSLMSFILILSSVTLNAVSHVLLRKAMIVVNAGEDVRHHFLQLAAQVIVNPFLLVGMSLYGVSIIIWLFVLSKIEVSVAYPFQSIGYIIAAMIAFFFLGENVSLLRGFGISLICFGLVFIALSA